jgi:hypothetical protein
VVGARRRGFVLVLESGPCASNKRSVLYGPARGRAKTRLRKAYVAARFSQRDKTYTRAAPKRSGGGTRRAQEAVYSFRLFRAGFEPFRACANPVRLSRCAKSLAARGVTQPHRRGTSTARLKTGARQFRRVAERRARRVFRPTDQGSYRADRLCCCARAAPARRKIWRAYWTNLSPMCLLGSGYSPWRTAPFKELPLCS